MAAFDRDNVTRNKTLGIPTRSNTPAWIAGIVIVVGAIIGVYAYESGWGTHQSVAPAPTQEMTQPALPPEPAKP